MNNCNSELNKNKSQTTKNKTENRIRENTRSACFKARKAIVSSSHDLTVALMLENVGDPWHMEKEEVHEREE